MSTERELLKQAYDAIQTNGYASLVRLKAEIKAELAKPIPKPDAWLYDFTIEGETITDWTTTDRDEISNPENGYHNIRPLYLSPQQQNPTHDPLGWWVMDDKPWWMENRRSQMAGPTDEWEKMYKDKIVACYTTPPQQKKWETLPEPDIEYPDED